MAGLINWRKKDNKKLSSAISRFNKQVKILEQSSPNFRVPEILNYKKIKNNITTRQEFNRVIESLNAFSRKGATEKVKIDSGMEITRWEQEQIFNLQRSSIRRLSKEMKNIKPGLGTGNTRLNEIKATLESVKKIQTTKGSEYNRLFQRLSYIGRSDLEMKKAKTFQENFIKTYTSLGRKEIVEVAKSYNNPLEFWDYIKGSGLSDLKLRYDEAKGIIQLAMDADDTYYYELFKLGITT